MSAILVRQNFAGKLNLHFFNIWDCVTYWCLPLNILLQHWYFVGCLLQSPTIQCWQSLDDNIDCEIISVDENIGLAPACRNCTKKEDNHKANQTVYGKHGESDGNFSARNCRFEVFFQWKYACAFIVPKALFLAQKMICSKYFRQIVRCPGGVGVPPPFKRTDSVTGFLDSSLSQMTSAPTLVSQSHKV